MIYYVGGINGVGKTSLLQGIAKKDNRFSHIKGSTLLMCRLGIRDGDYESLRNLSTELKNKEFGEIVKSLKSDKNHNILIDAHFINLINGKEYRVVDSWISYVDVLVLVEANENEVMNRILKDSGRNRAMFNDDVWQSKEFVIHKIHEYMLSTRTEFYNLSKKYLLPSIVIQNRENKINLGIESFLEFHNQHVSNHLISD